MANMKKAQNNLSTTLNLSEKLMGLKIRLYLETALNLFQAYQEAEMLEQADSIFYECLAIEERLIKRASAYFTPRRDCKIHANYLLCT